MVGGGGGDGSGRCASRCRLINGCSLARTLAGLAIGQMIRCDADEVITSITWILSPACSWFLFPLQIVLETEYDNAPSLTLYASLGFMLEKRLHRFYLNGKDAWVHRQGSSLTECWANIPVVTPPASDSFSLS